jgi:GT2 family glycosyltransferase
MSALPQRQRSLSMPPSVLIIVLCHNGVELTLACLESLNNVQYPRFDVLAVDNASTDDTPLMVHQRFPHVNVIETSANLGYAAGNNLGLRHALDNGYDYALLLNNDTEVAQDFLHKLVETCESDQQIGVAGPKIYLHERPNVIYTAGGAINWHAGTTETIGIGVEDRGQFDTRQDVDFINGCAFMARCEAIRQTGLIDVRFGMYFEEVEWCVRIARAGWRLVYAPASVVWHKIKLERHDQSPRVTYYMARNRLLFLRLTGAPPSAWMNALVRQDLRTWLSWTLRPKWRNRAPQRGAMTQAYRDYLRGRFGMVQVGG